MRQIGMGVVGWGFMGKTHTHALREMGLFYSEADFRPVLECVCTRRLEVARQAAQDAGFAHYTDDFDQLLAMPQVEAVSICTPNALHLPMALKALEAGKHVYIDKPLAMSLEEALRIQQAVERTGLTLQVAHNNRFFPAMLRARQLVDLILWLAGTVKEVCCRTRLLYAQRPASGGGQTTDLGEDQVLALMRLENGALGTLEASKIATGTDDELSFELYGDKGALRWRSMEADYLYFFDNTRPEAPLGGERGFQRLSCGARYPWPGGQFLPVKNTIGWDRAHMHCYFSFLNALVHGLPVSPGIGEAVALHRLMDAMKLSSQNQSWVSV